MKGILIVWQKLEGTTRLKWEPRIFDSMMYNGEVITLSGFYSTLTRKKIRLRKMAQRDSKQNHAPTTPSKVGLTISYRNPFRPLSPSPLNHSVEPSIYAHFWYDLHHLSRRIRGLLRVDGVTAIIYSIISTRNLELVIVCTTKDSR
jgi:hypothetical protein